MHGFEPVANRDERKLVGELGFLEEVLDLFEVVEVAVTTDSLNFTDLSSPSGSLDVLEVNLRILVEADDGAEVVIQT